MTAKTKKLLKVKTSLKAGTGGNSCEPEWYAGYQAGWDDLSRQYQMQQTQVTGNQQVSNINSLGA